MVEEPQTAEEAVKELDGWIGSEIMSEEWATIIAQCFGMEEPPTLRPISQMDRIQPGNDDLGIGAGSLIADLVDELGMESERPTFGGHGRTQRAYKEENLPKLEEYVEISA